jgi:hypothetical protein
MKWIGTKNIGMLLLGIWFVAWGVFAFLSIPYTTLLLATLAIATGVLILLGR